MATSSVEEIQEKVNRLINAYRSNIKELEELRSENTKLRNTISQSNHNSESNSFEKEQMRKKVDTLIAEVDKCVRLMAK